jgi:ketose-bisphosphate aldolase
MPIASMKQLMADARSDGRAVCYCESWNLESFQAVLEAAEEVNSPIIAGFNGGFLAHPSRKAPERLVYYASLVAAIRRSSARIAFLLNETDDLAQIEDGIELGFNAVMVESAHLEARQYQALVKRVVELSHRRGLTVEAQLGHLPDGWDGISKDGETTNPAAAAAFVEETGIDALGVSIGNVHILTRGKASIDLDSLRRIRDAVEIPLVVHGGTGFPPEYAAEAVELGVAKFNFGTNLKQAYLRAVRERLADYAEPMNPHPFLGMGGRTDIFAAAREAVKSKVKELVEIYGNPKGATRGDQVKAEGVGIRPATL